MNGINNDNTTTVAQSIVANIQLGLPSTVSKLSSKMRFIDKIAPSLKNGGVIRNIEIMNPVTIRASGIACTNRTSNAFGGILYVAGAVRQDILIKEGTIYKTRQESKVEVDEIDDLDSQKKLKFINIINSYKLLSEIMEDDEKPELVLLEVPLLLERSDAPLDNREDIIKIYEKCKKVIAEFWNKYQEQVYPFSKDGIKIASVGNKKFGAVLFALNEDGIKYIPDKIESKIINEMNDDNNMLLNKIKNVGIKRMMTGILVKRTRTAAFQYDGINNDNRIEPEELRKFGLIGMHVKAGNSTPPLLVEVLGSVKEWNTKMLDTIASQIISLITFDQDKALPMPLWYAKYSLRPLEATDNGKNRILEYYKAKAREALKNEELESVWKEDFDAFEE